MSNINKALDLTDTFSDQLKQITATLHCLQSHFLEEEQCLPLWVIQNVLGLIITQLGELDDMHQRLWHLYRKSTLLRQNTVANS